MNFLKSRFCFLSISLISLLSLSIAFFAEYFYKIPPCPLCLYTRYGYIILFVISLTTYFYPKNILRILQLCTLTGLLGLSTFHLGVEQRWWKGLASCEASSINFNDLKNLPVKEKLIMMRKKISNQNIVRCDQISWTILGISATFWNTLLLSIVTFFLVILWIKEKEFLKL